MINEKENIENEEVRNEEPIVEETENKIEAEQPEESQEESSQKPELTEEEKLQQKCNEQLLQLAAMQDKYLRLNADFDNYRKRTAQEKIELIKTAAEKTITEILPVLDDFERALANMKEAENVKAVREGVELIFQKFNNVLAHQGLKSIDTKEAVFDVDFHEAIAMVPAPVPELKGKVLDCVQTGYTLNEKVIRHAKVAVAQ